MNTYEVLRTLGASRGAPGCLDRSHGIRPGALSETPRSAGTQTSYHAAARRKSPAEAYAKE